MNYKDAHTHNISSQYEYIYIVPLNNIPKNLPSHYALGIHPWYLDKTTIAQLENLIQNYRPHILGECGLDKYCKFNYEQQIEIFKQQIELAKKYNIKRLVIHNVGHHNEVIKTIKESSFPGKILFHDYSGNQDLTKQYQQHFDCYFSLGSRLFNNQTKLVKDIHTLPIERILIETDDQERHSLEDIYAKVSELLKIPLSQLILRVEQNFNAFIA